MSHPLVMPLCICLLYISGVYIVAQSEAHYSIPLRPEMYLCAMLMLSYLLTQLNRLRNMKKDASGEPAQVYAHAAAHAREP
jgi:hypothetical protein